LNVGSTTLQRLTTERTEKSTLAADVTTTTGLF